MCAFFVYNLNTKCFYFESQPPRAKRDNMIHLDKELIEKKVENSKSFFHAARNLRAACVNVMECENLIGEENVRKVVRHAVVEFREYVEDLCGVDEEVTESFEFAIGLEFGFDHSKLSKKEKAEYLNYID